MEPKEEALQPPSEERLTEETQVNEQQAEMKESAKYVEPAHIEDYNDEFDLEAKLLSYRGNRKRLWEAVQRLAEEWEEEPSDIVLNAVAREVVYRELRRPGRRISLVISDDGELHTVRQLF